MSPTLRPYQRQAVDAINAYFVKRGGNPLVSLPVGSGKSLTMAGFIREALAAWPDTKICVVTHVKELIAQNYLELLNVWPEAPAGVYSAGLRRREIEAPVLFAGIQSIAGKVYGLPHAIDLVIVDECHLIPRGAGTTYRKFLADLAVLNPYVKTVGFTATPYRLDSGLLHEGEGAFFDALVHEADVGALIADGYLSPLISRPCAEQIDTGGVATRGGEFVARDLELAAMTGDATERAVDELCRLGADRRTWLVFGCGVAHCERIAALLNARGVSAAGVYGDTPAAERAALIADAKAGRVRCLVSRDVLTTGVNIPNIDLVGLMRPTKSAGLYVQAVGRATRLCPGKANALILDWGNNIERHGPLDAITARGRSKKAEGGDAPIKVCPECAGPCFAGARECAECGHSFPPADPKLALKASTAAILSEQIKPEWLGVDGVTYRRHDKPGRPPSLRVDYLCGLITHREWVCPEHDGYAREKAVAWWTKRAPAVPAPDTVDDALASVHALARPTQIRVRPAGKYTEVCGVSFA